MPYIKDQDLYNLLHGRINQRKPHRRVTYSNCDACPYSSCCLGNWFTPCIKIARGMNLIFNNEIYGFIHPTSYTLGFINLKTGKKREIL